MKNLLSAVWWRAAGARAVRTALIVLTPYVPTVIHDGNYALVGSVVGFAALSSLITSLFGIAETTGTTVTWYYAILERSVKTTAQALLTLFGTATMFQQVHWAEAPALIGTAVLGSLVLSFLGFLPETKDDTSPQVIPPSAQVPVPVEVGTVVVNNAAVTGDGRDAG